MGWPYMIRLDRRSGQVTYECIKAALDRAMAMHLVSCPGFFSYNDDVTDDDVTDVDGDTAMTLLTKRVGRLLTPCRAQPRVPQSLTFRYRLLGVHAEQAVIPCSTRRERIYLTMSYPPGSAVAALPLISP